MTAAVLFDLDGVLVDSYQVWFRVMNAAASAWGYPEIGEDEFAETFGQSVKADQEQWFHQQTVAEVGAFFDRAFVEHIDAMQRIPGVDAVLAELGRRQVPWAIVTNTPQALAERVVTEAALDPPALFGTGGENASKPAPDLLLAACRHLGVEPAAATMIGDSVYDQGAAEAAGTRFVGVGLEAPVRVERLDQLPGVLFPEG